VSVTREEAMTMIARALPIVGIDVAPETADAVNAALAPFADGAAVSGWARQVVAAAVASGLAEGSASGLQPSGRMTRAETAAIVERLLRKAGLIGE
jgi:hypothetical protein